MGDSTILFYFPGKLLMSRIRIRALNLLFSEILHPQLGAKKSLKQNFTAPMIAKVVFLDFFTVKGGG